MTKKIDITIHTILLKMERYYGDDTKLDGLMEEALKIITPHQLDTYVDTVKRFNKTPVWCNETPIDFYHLKNDFSLFPLYFESMKDAGLSVEAAFNLLVTTHQKHPYSRSQTTKSIEQLIACAEACKERGETLKQKPIEKILDLTNNNGEQVRALGIYCLSLHAGFTQDQAAAVVEYIEEHAPVATGYGLMNLYDELNSYRTHSVDPTLLFNTIQLATEKRFPYADLSDALIMAHIQNSSTGVSDALKKICQHLSENTAPLAEANFEPKAPTAKTNFDNWFPAIKTQTLVHGLFPYQKKRSLKDGIADLALLAHNSYTEGAFVFSPATETWYSFGGKTKIYPNRVRHEAPYIDISEHIASPLFVHTHPIETEYILKPSKDFLVEPSLRDHITKFLSAAPSNTDWAALASFLEKAEHTFQPRGAIITSSGLTLFSAPAEPNKIRAAAESFTKLKDDLLLSFNVKAYMHGPHANEKPENFARRQVKALGAQLPMGFSLTTIPYSALDKIRPRQPLFS